MTTLKWAEGKYKNALAEWKKYRFLDEEYPYQCYRARDNLNHWENVLYALENMKEVNKNENT